MARKPNSVMQVLARTAIERHIPDAAKLIDEYPASQIITLLETMPVAQATEVIKRLTPEPASQVLADANHSLARQLIEGLDPHRAAALLARLEPDAREDRLALLEPGLASEVRALIAYPPDTAGGLMDPRVTAFRQEASVREVVQRLRTLRRKKISDVFLVDEAGRLVGVVPLQEIVLAGAEQLLQEIAISDPPAVQATSPRDEVVETLDKYRVASLAVVDFEGKLLGVLRQRELIVAAEQEASADVQTMFGASKEERALSSPWFAVRKRLPWLQINLLTAFLAASVVGLFEQTIAQVTALAVLLPVVAGQSGNTGAQALAVTMRGLALREVRIRQWLRVSAKELAVGALNGVAVALTTSGAVLLWSGSKSMAAVIGISMVISMMVAALAGAVIPMALTAIRQDPAQSSSIILTTVTDVVGFFSFLGIATAFFAYLPAST
jgi:magnesium transporter